MPEEPQYMKDYMGIRQDNISGSTKLAVRVAQFIEKYGKELREETMGLAEKLSMHFAGMGLVRNTILSLVQSLEGGSQVMGAAESLKERIREQADRALEGIAPLFSSNVKLVTISRSSQVEEAILEYRNRIDHVYLLESRPMLEGRSLHVELRRQGIASTLLTDASAAVACRKSDLALVGCDSLLGDGTLIHKTGTFPLFSMMRLHSGMNYSLGIGMKHEKQFSISSYPEIPGRGCEELGIMDGSCINQYLEKIPGHMLDGFYDENGLRQGKWGQLGNGQ